MGSVPSTPNREGTDDPWWPIENQNLELNPFVVDANSDRIVNMEHEHETHTDETPGSSANSFDKNEPNTVNSEDQQLIAEHNVSECESSASASQTDVSCENLENQNPAPSKSRDQTLEEFKEELRLKREKRQNAIAELRNEISSLRKQLAEEKAVNKRLMCEKHEDNVIETSIDDDHNIDAILDKTTYRNDGVALRSHLAEVQLSLQNANAEILLMSVELTATKRQVSSLKEVVAAAKEMVEIRETQLTQLKAKLSEIEASLAERELNVMSENLRQEYDRQLTNIRNLRALYEERARISIAEKENLNRQLETSRAELVSEIEKNKNLEEHIASLDVDLKSTSNDLYATKEQVSYYKGENRGLHEEMAVINQLFSQLLAGFGGCNDIDIDKLTHMLEENRDLLNDMTNRESCKEGAAQLPKLLFDLVSEVDKNETVAAVSEIECDERNVPSTSDGNLNKKQEETASSIGSKVTSAQEIMNNLPKVWRVLIELLNHQKTAPVQFNENNESEDCYKSVQTPTGPQMVLSVSKTYIKLKDLILEKKFLQKETHKLKNLNSHLETRLGQQEKRLGAVSIELNKTWNLVGRMQRQHRQLHTHEQVLRYQLQQKRRMLGELKDELEYCRRKWALAKEKNKESQSQWDSLRLEFSKRKEMDASNSAESGYSDGPASEEDDDESVVNAESYDSGKRKANKEKFLLNIAKSERKSARNHSVSPVRCSAKTSISRRNSDSHITQFATEEFQVPTDMVQPIIHSTCIECGENCVKHSVHFESNSAEPSNNAQLKITEPIVRSPISQLTNARKLVETKALATKSKMCCELRKRQLPTTSKAEESLEAMFLRLSGQEPEQQQQQQTGEDDGDEIDKIESETVKRPETLINNESTPDDDDDDAACTDELAEATFLSSDDERRVLRAARIQRLEEQCKSLLKQVMKTSNRGDELNRQIDEVHKRYTPARETPPNESDEITNEPLPSTSTASISEPITPVAKTDTECLTATEQAYTSRREERLKRLEQECKAFLSKVNATNSQAVDVDNKLEFLHGRYGAEMTSSTTEATDDNATETQISTDIRETPLEEFPSESEDIELFNENEQVITNQPNVNGVSTDLGNDNNNDETPNNKNQ